MSEAIFDPTARIDVDFRRHIEGRKAFFDARCQGGIPDYAFNLDHVIRAKLNAVPLLRKMGEVALSHMVPITRQLQQMDSVAVGPKQFPEIHAMGVDCARRLGIGVPQLFVMLHPWPNAFTIATAQTDQIVVMTSGLMEALTPTQIHSVIGHECGHIHNEHVVYNTLWELLTNPLADMLVRAATGGLGPIGHYLRLLAKGGLYLLFQRWHRCAEFTSDRAGVICCGDIDAATEAEVRLITQGAATLKGFDEEEFAKQLEGLEGSPIRFLELLKTHPIGPRRVKAMRHFSESEVLYGWRPDMKRGEKTRPHVDVDRACADLLI
jgi:Zn-dependent protease with chaperone function